MTKLCTVMCGRCVPCLKEQLAMEQESRRALQKILDAREWGWAELKEEDIMLLWQLARININMGDPNPPAMVFARSISFGLKKLNWQAFLVEGQK